MDVAVLTGRWVRLEPLAEEHREPLRAAADDERIWVHTLTAARGPEFDRWFDYVLACHAAGRQVPFAVRRLGDQALVGSTSYLDPVPEHCRVEIGSTWYAKRVQRSAVNTQCKLLLLTHAFEKLDCIAVEFRTHFFNHQSRRGIERLGAKQDGVLRNHQIAPNGTLRDTVVYSIIASEWPTVRAHLNYQLDDKPR